MKFTRSKRQHKASVGASKIVALTLVLVFCAWSCVFLVVDEREKPLHMLRAEVPQAERQQRNQIRDNLLHTSTDEVGEDLIREGEVTETKTRANDDAQVVQVPSKKLDDMVLPNNKAFLLKVDTQSFELSVFSGLTESLAQHKIQFVLTEFRPRRMDLLAGKPDHCVGAEMLQLFLTHGYTLYAMPADAHPKGPNCNTGEIALFHGSEEEEEEEEEEGGTLSTERPPKIQKTDKRRQISD